MRLEECVAACGRHERRRCLAGHRGCFVLDLSADEIASYPVLLAPPTALLCAICVSRRWSAGRMAVFHHKRYTKVISISPTASTSTDRPLPVRSFAQSPQTPYPVCSFFILIFPASPSSHAKEVRLGDAHAQHPPPAGLAARLARPPPARRRGRVVCLGRRQRVGRFGGRRRVGLLARQQQEEVVRVFGVAGADIGRRAGG